MRRVELTAAERELARLVNLRCDELVSVAKVRADELVRAAIAAAKEHATWGQRRVLELVRERGVEIAAEDLVEPVRDRTTAAAVAIRITPAPRPEPKPGPPPSPVEDRDDNDRREDGDRFERDDPQD